MSNKQVYLNKKKGKVKVTKKKGSLKAVIHFEYITRAPRRRRDETYSPIRFHFSPSRTQESRIRERQTRDVVERKMKKESARERE